jgi:hypothetical protein
VFSSRELSPFSLSQFWGALHPSVPALPSPHYPVVPALPYASISRTTISTEMRHHPMTKQERLYGIRRQLDRLGYRADRLNAGPSPGHPHGQDGAPAHPVRPRLGFLTANPQQHEPHLFGAARPRKHAAKEKLSWAHRCRISQPEPGRLSLSSSADSTQSSYPVSTFCGLDLGADSLPPPPPRLLDLIDTPCSDTRWLFQGHAEP